MPSIPTATWYYPVPVGKNTLSRMVKDMFSEAGLDGNKTNHSLRVAGTSSLYEAGVPEKVIQSRMGHRCLESLRLYERVNTTREMAVSRILTGETEKYDESDDPAIVEASSKQEEASKSLFPGIQCNNCTVNVFFWSGSTALHSTCSSITSILQLLSIFLSATIISTSI